MSCNRELILNFEKTKPKNTKWSIKRKQEVLGGGGAIIMLLEML